MWKDVKNMKKYLGNIKQIRGKYSEICGSRNWKRLGTRPAHQDHQSQCATNRIPNYMICFNA